MKRFVFAATALLAVFAVAGSAGASHGGTLTVPVPTLPEQTVPTLPQLVVPELTVPTLPQLTVPQLTTPTLPEQTVPTLPQLVVPELTVPTLPQLQVPQLQVPTLVVPELPKLEVPTLPVPEIQAPVSPAGSSRSGGSNNSSGSNGSSGATVHPGVIDPQLLLEQLQLLNSQNQLPQVVPAQAANPSVGMFRWMPWLLAVFGGFVLASFMRRRQVTYVDADGNPVEPPTQKS